MAKKNKTVADARADGTLPELPDKFIKRVQRLDSPLAGMIADDAPAGRAIDMIINAERGQVFKRGGRGASPLQKLLKKNLVSKHPGARIRYTAADIFHDLQFQAPAGWEFIGDPEGALCEVWYRGKRVCASFQSFKNSVTKAKNTPEK